MVDSSLVRGYR